MFRLELYNKYKGMDKTESDGGYYAKAVENDI